MRNGKPKPTESAGARARSRARDELDEDDLDLFVWLDAEGDRIAFTKNLAAWRALARAGAVSITEVEGGAYVKCIVLPEVLGL